MKHFHFYQLITGVSFFATLLFAFPNTIQWLEEDDLFLFTNEYITSVFLRQQGVAYLIVNFIEQFFSNVIVGSLIYTLVLLLSTEILYLVLRKIGKNNILFLALIPAPIIVLFVFPDLVPSVSLLFFALALLGFVSLKTLVIRCTYALALPLLSYMVMPWSVASIMFIGFSVIELTINKKKISAVIMLLAVIESLFVPAIWSDMASFIPFENRPFEGLGEGVTIGVLITYAIIIIVLALHISYYFKKWIGYVATIAVSLLFCITLATDDLHTFVERMQKVSRMADNKDWSGILSEISYEDYRRNKAYMCYSMLAESALGTLPHNLMKYSINDPENFLFRHESNSYLINFNRQFYENIGIWDEAFRQAFEYGINSRENECFKTLRHKTDYALATYDLGTAEKYINLLKRSCNNTKWVSIRAAKLDSLKKTTFPERPYRSDTFVDAYPIASSMIRLLERDKNNKKILDYLLCSLLLQKEVDKFGIILKNFNLYEGEPLPRVYAEAVAALSFKDSTVRKLGNYDTNLENQYVDCVNKARNGENCSSYAGTYWSYLLFAQLPSKKESSQQ